MPNTNTARKNKKNENKVLKLTQRVVITESSYPKRYTENTSASSTKQPIFIGQIYIKVLTGPERVNLIVIS